MEENGDEDDGECEYTRRYGIEMKYVVSTFSVSFGPFLDQWLPFQNYMHRLMRYGSVSGRATRNVNALFLLIDADVCGAKRT